MAQTLVVITYGNGDILREVFNAIAAAMGDSPFQTLIHLSILLGGTWAAFELITKRSLMEGVKWVSLYFIAFYIVFLPKATVEIIDRVQQSKVYAVDNVPLGLAILANFTSVIGDSLTQEIEKTFTMPDYLPYGQTGMVMASNLVTAASTFQITEPVFEESMQSFTTQCIFYDLLLNKYTAQELLSAPNIWTFVAGYASPARAFMYHRTVTTCKDGIGPLTQDWTTAIADAATRYGARLFPEDKQAKTQLLKYLPISYRYLTNISEDASALIQQNMLANAIQNGILGWSAHADAPAALQSYAFNKAQQQTRIGNRTVGDMAAYWLPLLKNVFEGILYGSFIFIFLLLLFPFGLNVLRQYAYSLCWLQLWAPLYAIINLFVCFYAQHRSLGAVTLSDGSQVLSLSTQSGLAQVNSDMAGLAGYISMSVPIIAAGLVKGLAAAFSQVAQYVGGVSHSAAGAVAAETASGNLSLGNTSFSTHHANNTSANHFDTNATTASGMIAEQMPGGSTLGLMADGSMVMNNQAAISNLGTTINLASAIRSTAMEQADMAYSAALSHQQSYNEAISAARRDAVELSRTEGTTQSSGTASIASLSAGDATAMNAVDQQSSNLLQTHNALEEASRNRTVNANAGVQGSLGVGGGIGASASVSGNLGASANLAHGMTQSEQNAYLQNEGSSQTTAHTHSVDTILRDVQEGNYRTSSEEGRRLVENISASLDRANQEQKQAAAQFQQAESYRRVATLAEENAVSINSNATQEFMGQLQHSGQSMRNIEQVMVNHPEEAQSLASQFVQHRVHSFIQQFHGKAHASPEQVERSYIDAEQSLQTQHKDNKPEATYKADHEQAVEKAHQEGLERDNLADKSATVQVGKDIVKATHEMEDSKKGLQLDKEKLAKKVDQNQSRLRDRTNIDIAGIKTNQIEEDKAKK